MTHTWQSIVIQRLNNVATKSKYSSPSLLKPTTVPYTETVQSSSYPESHYTKLYFNITLPFIQRFPIWSMSVRLWNQNFVLISCSPINALSPTNFNLRPNYWLTVKMVFRGNGCYDVQWTDLAQESDLRAIWSFFSIKDVEFLGSLERLLVSQDGLCYTELIG
jgi:hypothetical protein